MLPLWDRWAAAPNLATWRLRLSQSLNWREPTLLAYLSPPWMQGISMKSIRRTSTNPRLACASSEEWWNNPMYLADLWRQLRQRYNKAVADNELIGHLLQPCGWQGLGALAGFQGWASEVGELNSGHWNTRDLPAPHNINRQELSQRSLSQCQDPAPFNDQQAPMLDTPCQTISKTGTHLHPLAEKLPKIIISSQTPQNTPLDTFWPKRKTRSSLIHQNTGTSPFHQEAYTTHWNNLTHWGQTPKTTGTMDLQPAKWRPQTQ